MSLHLTLYNISKYIRSLIVSGFVATPLFPAFVPENPETVFTSPGIPASLRLRTDAANLHGKPLSFVVNDYTGRTVATGETAVDGSGRVAVPVVLPAGFYEVSFPAAGEGAAPVGVMSMGQPAEGKDPGAGEGFFSIDTALSWLTPPEKRPALIGNLRHVIEPRGLARERFSWAAITPAEGRWNWAADKDYDNTRRLYAEAGVRILEMFHDAPRWMGRSQNGNFPDDLIAAARSWCEVATRWHGYWAALEVWNEPDIGFGAYQPADQYLPLVKTIRHTMRAAGINTPIGGGAYASLNPDYLDLSSRNGLLDECDFISFHYYGDPLGLERHVSEYRAWLRACGHESKPLWLTEVGQPWHGKPVLRADVKTQAVTALAFAMQAVESRACGVAAHYPFVYVDYNEGNRNYPVRNYGMLDRTGSPLRPFAAYAQTARLLTGATCIGDIVINGVPGARRIRVFETPADPGDAIIAIYTGEVASDATAAAAATVRLPFAARAAFGIDGRALAIAENGRVVSVTDGIAWLRAPRSRLSAFLKTDTEAARLLRLARPATTDSVAPVSPIVLQPQIDIAKVTAISRGYLLPAGLTRLPVTIWINNLSDATHTITLENNGAAPAQTVTVAKNSRQAVTLDIDARVLPVSAGGISQLAITASATGIARIAPAALSLMVSDGKGVEEHLKASAYHFALPINETHRWDKNASGGVTFTRSSTEPFRIDVRFPPNVDRWAFPRFSVPQEADRDRITGVLVRARVSKSATVRLMSWGASGDMSFTKFPILPADGEWHVAYIPFSGYLGFGAGGSPGQQIDKLSIGLNSQVDEISVEISDLYLIGK
ncbi:glycosyhydrolase [Opitutaceae bacterium TAV5]|nr:glycosyhydrolase [Opitutaceae bacterium TAV5]